MKWGLIARSETDRGLGIQTFEMFRHLNPDATLVVLVPKSGFASHPENYPGAATVELRIEHGLGVLDEQTVRDWWSGLDVVVSVETLYDWRLVEWARADGVRTIVHGNPEFWMASNPQPDVWWWPTTWRLEHLPHGPVVPVPVPTREICAADPGVLLKLVHVAGNGAMADRNGTNIVLNAMRQIPKGVTLDIYTQAAVAQSKHARVRILKSVSDRWEMYRDRQMLVLPRRYGGLCLPALEAMACGLGLIMSDCSPNTNWPIVAVQSDLSKTVQMQTGPVETYDVPFNVLANMMKHLANNPGSVEQAQRRSREFAAANGWDQLAEMYHEQIDRSRSV